MEAITARTDWYAESLPLGSPLAGHLDGGSIHVGVSYNFHCPSQLTLYVSIFQPLITTPMVNISYTWAMVLSLVRGNGR